MRNLVLPSEQFSQHKINMLPFSWCQGEAWVLLLTHDKMAQFQKLEDVTFKMRKLSITIFLLFLFFGGKTQTVFKETLKQFRKRMHRWSSKEAGTLRVLFLNVAEEKRRGLITKLDFSCCFIKLLPHLKPTRLIFLFLVKLILLIGLICTNTRDTKRLRQRSYNYH